MFVATSAFVTGSAVVKVNGIDSELGVSKSSICRLPLTLLEPKYTIQFSLIGLTDAKYEIHTENIKVGQTIYLSYNVTRKTLIPPTAEGKVVEETEETFQSEMIKKKPKNKKTYLEDKLTSKFNIHITTSKYVTVTQSFGVHIDEEKYCFGLSKRGTDLFFTSAGEHLLRLEMLNVQRSQIQFSVQENEIKFFQLNLTMNPKLIPTVAAKLVDITDIRFSRFLLSEESREKCKRIMERLNIEATEENGPSRYISREELDEEEKKEQLNTDEAQNTLLFYLAATGNLAVFKKIKKIKQISKISSVLDANDNTLLHAALEHENYAVCKYLIKKEETIINQGNKQGNTVLHLSSATGSLPKLFWCLKNEAKIDIQNNYGDFLIQIAHFFQDFPQIHFLIALGVVHADQKQFDYTAEYSLSYFDSFKVVTMVDPVYLPFYRSCRRDYFWKALKFALVQCKNESSSSSDLLLLIDSSEIPLSPSPSPSPSPRAPSSLNISFVFPSSFLFF